MRPSQPRRNLTAAIAICALGVALAAGPRDPSGRHFFRGHQVPSLVGDNLEDQLHDLRVLTESSVPELTREEPSETPKATEAAANEGASTGFGIGTPDSETVQQALVGPLERQLENLREDLGTPSTANGRAEGVARRPTIPRPPTQGEAESPRVASVRTSERVQAEFEEVVQTEPVQEVSSESVAESSDSSESSSVQEETRTESDVTSHLAQKEDEEKEDEEGGDEDDDDEDENDDPEATDSSSTSPIASASPQRHSQPYVLRSNASDKRDNEKSQAVEQQQPARLPDPQKLMAPESEERLLELMVKLAEHPVQWERVHHELEHLDHELVASRRAVQLLSHSSGEAATSTSPEEETAGHPNNIPRLPDPLVLENEVDRVQATTPPPSHMETPHQHEHHHHGNGPASGKPWPQFSYHRVTAIPAVADTQSHSMAAAPGRHRSAYIAVSVVTPPKLRGKVHDTSEHRAAETSTPGAPPRHELPDVMDLLVSGPGVARPPLHRLTQSKASSETAATSSQSTESPVTSEHQGSVATEEREIERLVASLRAQHDNQAGTTWDHQRHRDQMKEQLRALESLHAQIEARWRAQERVQELNTGGGHENTPELHSGSSSHHHPQSPSRRQ